MDGPPVRDRPEHWQHILARASLLASVPEPGLPLELKHLDTDDTPAAALAAAQDELGDVIAVLVNLGRRSGIDAEAALRGANDKFRRRFAEVERRAAARGIALKSADFATLDALWDEAKAVERSQS